MIKPLVFSLLTLTACFSVDAACIKVIYTTPQYENGRPFTLKNTCSHMVQASLNFWGKDREHSSSGDSWHCCHKYSERIKLNANGKKHKSHWNLGKNSVNIIE